MNFPVKKWIAFAITLVMVFTMLPSGLITPVHAEEPTANPEAQASIEPKEPHCVCGGAAVDMHDCDNTTQWTAWTSTTTLPTATGNYYLTDNVTVTAGTTAAGNVVLDLNGKTVTADNGGVVDGTKNISIYTVGASATLTILDSSDSKTGALIGCKAGAFVSNSAAGTKTAIIANTKGGTVHLYGGTLDASACTDSTNQGPCIEVNNASHMYMYGGTIIGGKTTNYGGSIYVNNGSTFNMYGGLIYGGSAGANNGWAGHNLFVGGNPNGSVSLEGGTIMGGVYTSGNTVTVSGSIQIPYVIVEGATQSYGLASNGDRILVGDLSEDALLSFDRSGSGACAHNSDQTKTYTTGSVIASDITSCLCGNSEHTDTCNGEPLTWTPWTSRTALPSTAGNHYLTGDVNIGTGNIAVSTSFNLDLHGFSVICNSDKNSNAFTLKTTGTTVSIVDHIGGGKIDISNAKSGRIFEVNASSTFLNIYGGTFVGAYAGSSNSFGGTFYVNGYGTLNIYAATVYGGTADSNGDNIFCGGSGILNLYGGTIYGGTKKNAVVTTGGAVTLSGNVKILAQLAPDNMDTGIGFDANGKQNVITIGNLTDTAMIVCKNTNAVGKPANGETATYYPQIVFNGEGDYVAKNESGTICFVQGRLGCVCGTSNDVHNEYCDQQIHCWEAWTNTTSLPKTAGNYYLIKNVTNSTTYTLDSAMTIRLDLNGQTVTSSTCVFTITNTNTELIDFVLTDRATGGTITTASNRIFQFGKNATVSIYGGTYCGAKNVDYGGTFYVNWGGVLNVYGGTIYDGTASIGGDNIFIGGTEAPSANLFGGTIYGGNTSGVRVNAGGKITIGGNVQILEKLSPESENIGYGLLNNSGASAIEILDLAETALIYINDTANVATKKIYDKESGTYVNDPAIYCKQIKMGSLTAAAYSTFDICLNNGTVRIADDMRVRCLCGVHTGEGTHHKDCPGIMMWQKWTSTSLLPKNSGNYFLSDNVTLTDGFFAVSQSSTLNLDLNGKQVDSTRNGASGDGNYFNMYDIKEDKATLNIIDSAGEGSLNAGLRNSTGAIVRISGSNCSFNLWSGTINGSTTTQVKGNKDTTIGGPISIATITVGAKQYIPENSSINIYGGSIIGFSNVGAYTVTQTPPNNMEGVEEFITRDETIYYTFQNATAKINGSCLYIQAGNYVNLYADCETVFGAGENKVHMGDIQNLNVDCTVHTRHWNGGVCSVCGALTQLVATNTRFETDLSMLFAFNKDAVNSIEGYTFYATVNGKTATYKVTESNINGAACYVVEVTGIKARMMTDEVVVAVKDAAGNVVSQQSNTSIRDYAAKALIRTESDAFRTLLVDTLNYGAVAQTMFDYKADDLANKDLSDEQKAFATETMAAVSNSRDVSAANDLFIASNLRFTDKINLLFKLNIDFNTYVEFTWGGNTVRMYNDAYTFDEKDDTAHFVIELEGLTISDARTDVTCTVYNKGDNTVVMRITDSVAANVARCPEQSEYSDLYVAFMKFADAAMAYAASKQ